MRNWIVWTIGWAVLGCGSTPTLPPSPPELDVMTLAARPLWADRYVGSAPDERFFDIEAIMQHHGLDRAHAVELQNHFRDQTRAAPKGDRSAQYQEALRRARAGEFEDRRDLKRLGAARFIVVFDLDQTLYDQRIDDATLALQCHDFSASNGSDNARPIKLVPGWSEAIHRIDALGGAIVLFSANLDDRCYANARAWMLDGSSILEHPAIAGFLTNSHLILQPKHAGTPVLEPSKDLRIINPDLSRVLVVDDNPHRLFQLGNARIVKKFEAEAYCAERDSLTASSYERGLTTIIDEIEESVHYMNSHPTMSFATAYRPYTLLGQVALRFILAEAADARIDAIDYLRTHPELVDAEF